VTSEINREAMSRYFDLIDTGDSASVRAELSMWLSRNPAHSLAWARAQRIARLTVAYLNATDPGVETEQLDTFGNALGEE
jgi:ferric-dicitrate binding protein FerR (iron transport regulator)